MGTLANSEGPDEMLQNAAFHQGLHFLLRSKQFSGIDIHHNFEISTCGPLKYIMDNPILIAFICMRKSTRKQRVNKFTQIRCSIFCLFDLILYVPVNNLSVTSRQVFLG